LEQQDYGEQEDQQHPGGDWWGRGSLGPVLILDIKIIDHWFFLQRLGPAASVVRSVGTTKHINNLPTTRTGH